MSTNYDYELELNWAKDCHLKNWNCDRNNCKRRADMETEVNNLTNNGKYYGVYCKNHYETLFEDLIRELADPLEASDYLIEED